MTLYVSAKINFVSKCLYNTVAKKLNLTLDLKQLNFLTNKLDVFPNENTILLYKVVGWFSAIFC